MLPGFSGTLLDAELAAGGGTPRLLGGGAAADPGAFFVGEPDTPRGASAASPVSPPARRGSAGVGAAGGGRAFSLDHANTRDLLRELESGADDLFLPMAPPPAAHIPPASFALGRPGPGAAGTPGGSAPTTTLPSTPPLAPTGLRWPAGAVMPAYQLPAAALPAAVPVAPLGVAPAGTPLASMAELRRGLAAPVPPSPFMPAAAAPAAKPPASSAAPASNEAKPAACPATTSSAEQRPVPHVASLPNLHIQLPSGTESSGGAAAVLLGLGAQHKALPRPHSHNDLEATSGQVMEPTVAEDLPPPDESTVPHLPFLTPAHLRKGKGGRRPAADPRLDPKMDPKKARRIMANRLSAAKSKMKQRGAGQAERQQVDALCLQRDSLAAEVEAAEAACVREEVEQAVLASQVHAAEQQLAVHQLQARAAFSLSPGWYGL